MYIIYVKYILISHIVHVLCVIGIEIQGTSYHRLVSTHKMH